MKESEFLIRCKNCDYEGDSGIKCPNCEDEYMYVVKKI